MKSVRHKDTKKEDVYINSEMDYEPRRHPKYEDAGENTVKVLVWELPVRLWHWINAACIAILMVTGYFIGKPFLSASIQEEAYYSFLMGWSRYIHFFTAFVFTAALLVRIYWSFVGNKYSIFTVFKKGFWKEMFETVKYYLFMKNKKPHYVGHNPLAQFAYWVMFGACCIIIIFTGYFLYIEPQHESMFGFLFAWVPYVFGDSSSIRTWHHLAAWGIIIFTVVHIYLAFREDYLQRNGTMSSIITGYKTESKKHVVGGEDDKQ